MNDSMKSPFQMSREQARMNRESRRQMVATPPPPTAERPAQDNPMISNAALTNLGEGLREILPAKGFIDKNIVGI